MFKKKTFVILLCLIFLLGAISCVSASDLNVTDEQMSNDGNNESEVISEVDFDQYVEDDVGVTENNEVLGDTESFSSLANLISQDYEITLTSDYEYDPSYDSAYPYGIPIEDDVIINGNGHTINGNGKRIFSIDEYAECYIYNVTFKNVKANQIINYGGAILNQGYLEIYDSIFINNYAGIEGGAIYNDEEAYLLVDDCIFINNNIIENDDEYTEGGAISSMGYLEVSNSIFGNCSADFGGAISTSGEAYIDKCDFGLIDFGDDSIITPNVAIRGGAIYNHFVDSGESMPICEVSNSYFNYNVAEDGGALYNVIAMQCGFGSSNFYNDISENGYNMYYGVDLDCYASDDDPDNYYDTIISVGFTLTPVKLIIVPSDNSFKVLVNNNDGDKEPIPGVEVHIEVDDGKGTLNDLPKDDYNRYYNTTNVDGIVSFPMAGLTQGYHKITVGFTNSYYQGGKESTYNVHIGLIESTIEYNKNLNFNYGGSDSLVITVVGGSVGSQNVYVVGQPNKVSVRGNTITVFGLNAGNYNLHIDTTPIEGYKSTTALVPITVNKVFAYISASSFSAVYKSKKTWTVKVRDANNKPVAGVKVKVKVGSKVVQYTTNSKGEVYFKASLFKAGKFKASISAFNGNYIITPVTSTVKITKLTNIKYDYVHAKKNGGTGLTVTVFKKGTKQSLKNVKVLVKICKGNKVVKKFTMKTKRIGKYYGFGFGINKLPKGTYAVKLSPVNKNKYKGNGQTSIKVYKKGNWFKKV